MVELVNLIAKSLVDNPDQVQVTEVTHNQTTIIEVRVAPEDMGKIIGKQGKIAKSMRAVVKAASTKQNKRVIVEIVQ